MTLTPSLLLLTIIWITLPFFLGFLGYLLPRCDRYFAGVMAVLSVAYALLLFWQPNPVELRLLDHFGVSLLLDSLTGFFVITNGLVTAAVVCYCWQSNKTPFFYAQILMLHGSINASFACSDLMSLYVALEVLGIAAFLLIAYPRSDRSIWVGLRYLFVSNTVMLFYLVGAVLVYQANHSFDFVGLRTAPPEAIALILVGLLVKAGIFISGLWLPLTHSESETPVSALMSGVVVKASVLPLVRCALLFETAEPIVRLFGVATALFGVCYAVFEKDTKRMLAFHTISQLGFVLAAPLVGGFYALTHGLVKSALFLIAGNLPSRSFKVLKHQPIWTPLWVALVIASFSISGFPLLSGFGAKVLTMKNLAPWQVIGMNLAALGTATSFAKLIFLPHQPQAALAGQNGAVAFPVPNRGFWLAMVILLGGLVVTNGVYYEAYTWANVTKPLVTIALGWGVYHYGLPRLSLQLPQALEQFEHLIGMMAVMLVALLWMVMV